ncbi:MAG: dTDP-4-dehydrorhamnose 3,5-epimerase [Ignavibacteriaceae bacterium]|nr:dTDP-4-dehydrorhamnose 3,5-epimerase [Ignavibacteriaceae bacterium]
MEIVETRIDDLIVLKPKVFGDSRGYFYEEYREDVLSSLGINVKFVQDNISKSVKNTIRGLHYQIGDFAQGKLCHVLVGKVLDVAVDIRFGSPTFGKCYAIELSDENHLFYWIPPGFAHGFAVLSETALFHYKCTAYYNKASEKTLLYNDPELNIDWKVETPIVSEKDLIGTKFSDIEKDFVFNK